MNQEIPQKIPEVYCKEDWYNIGHEMQCWNCFALGDILSIKKGKQRPIKCPICGNNTLKIGQFKETGWHENTPNRYDFIIDEENGVNGAMTQEIWDLYYQKYTATFWKGTGKQGSKNK